MLWLTSGGKIGDVQTVTKLQRFKRVCHKYLVLHDDTYIDVIFGVIFANRLDSKPVWLYLVGAPSSGKTEIIQALTGPEIYPVTKLTPATLMSGKVEPGRKKIDHSLLPKLNGKVMIIKDFTAILHSRRDNLLEIIGLLRDAYDGMSRAVFGTGKDAVYYSKFGVIAAVTNVIDKHRGILVELGERFLTYRCPEVSIEESQQRCWKVSAPHSMRQQEDHLKKAALDVLNLKVRRVVLSDTVRHRIIRTASYVARARCEIQRDQYTKEPEIPMPEVATRLTRQLCDLAIGIAIAREQRYVSGDIQRLVQKTAIDCITLKRLSLLRILFDTHPKWTTSLEVSYKINFSESIVRRWLEDMLLLGLVEQQREPHRGGYRFTWRLTDKSLLHQVWG